MRILIDECLDWRLCSALPGNNCVSVHQMGWEGLTNGMLLLKAQEEFDVFLTADRSLRFQQNLTRFNIAIIVLEAQSTRLSDTAKLMPRVIDVLRTVVPGQVVRIRLTSK